MDYNLDDLKLALEKFLDKNSNRYNHSINVMNLAGEYAKHFNYDVKIAMKTGLMHDLAKHFSDKQALDYVKENNLSLNNIEEKLPHLLHGKIGADICKKQFNFSEEMCNAIKYHTAGRANMTLLDKIIFCADKTEPNRMKYYDVNKYKKIILEDIDKGFLAISNDYIKKKLNNNELILPDSIYAHNFILLNTMWRT